MRTEDSLATARQDAVAADVRRRTLSDFADSASSRRRLQRGFARATKTSPSCAVTLFSGSSTKSLTLARCAEWNLTLSNPKPEIRSPKEIRSAEIRNEKSLRTTLVLIHFGNSAFVSRRDKVRIAQRFNAGFRGGIRQSPEGTAEIRRRYRTFFRPYGTCVPSRLNPALKRWAILECPSGTHNQPDSRKALRLARILQNR